MECHSLFWLCGPIIHSFVSSLGQHFFASGPFSFQSEINTSKCCEKEKSLPRWSESFSYPSRFVLRHLRKEKKSCAFLWSCGIYDGKVIKNKKEGWSQSCKRLFIRMEKKVQKKVLRSEQTLKQTREKKIKKEQTESKKSFLGFPLRVPSQLFFAINLLHRRDFVIIQL